MAASLSHRCDVCLKTNKAGSGGELLPKGCLCRGGNEFAHPACWIEYARVSSKAVKERGVGAWHRIRDFWSRCTTCKHLYGGPFNLAMMKARYVAALASEEGEGGEHYEWIEATLRYGEALRATGRVAEARGLAERARAKLDYCLLRADDLSSRERDFQLQMHSLFRVVIGHSLAMCSAAALNFERAVVEYKNLVGPSSGVFGVEHPRTHHIRVCQMRSQFRLRPTMKTWADLLAATRRAAEVYELHYGSDSYETIRMKSNMYEIRLGECGMRKMLGDQFVFGLDAAVALEPAVTRTWQTALRVLGPDHADTGPLSRCYTLVMAAQGTEKATEALQKLKERTPSNTLVLQTLERHIERATGRRRSKRKASWAASLVLCKKIA